MNITNIAQFGTDGFGHQIHGMASCMALHDKVINDSKIRFDPHWSINERPYSFEHITDEDGLCEQYMKKAFENFAIRNDLQTQTYDEVYPLPDEFRTMRAKFPGKRRSVGGHGKLSNLSKGSSVLHLYDNLWGTANSTGAMDEYRQDMKLDWVTNNDKLPPSRFSDKTTNVTIQMRLGDASRRKENRMLFGNLNAVVDKLINTLDAPQITIHTNGEFEIDSQYVEIQYKETHVLDVLSDLIYSDILIGGQSSIFSFAMQLRPEKCNIPPERLKSFLDTSGE